MLFDAHKYNKKNPRVFLPVLEWSNLITEIKCVMLFLSFLISAMWYTLEQFLTGQRGLIQFYAENNI
jgi:hypothetical protein